MNKPFWERRLEEIQTADYNQVRDRVSLHSQQYIERGFDDSDTWSLYVHLAKLILPRLLRYRELADEVIVIDFPLDAMIEAFEIIVSEDWSYPKERREEKAKIIEIGLKAFAEYYFQLWW